MESHVNLLIILVLVCSAAFVPAGFAQEAASPQAAVPAEQAEASIPPLPYVAQITADNVNVRSGPGTNYYNCGKLNTGDRIKVVATQFSWSRIVPPPGSFSWISKQYVRIDQDNAAVGTVTGDAVRVYAGSEHLKPIHSTTVQLKLDTDDKVNLLGEEKGDYYKIIPPTGSYLWVSTQYTVPLGPVGQVPLDVERPAELKAEKRIVVPTNISLESTKLKEYYALQKQMELERAKPMAKQDYSAIKKMLASIASLKESGKAARYADFALKQIDRCELALKADKEVKLQEQQLKQVCQRIEKARTTKSAQVPELGKFIVIGQFLPSNIYGPEAELIRYRVIDESGKTLCYAVPDSEMDLSEFIGKNVGLVGSAEPHPQTAGALVRFTEISELK